MNLNIRKIAIIGLLQVMITFLSACSFAETKTSPEASLYQRLGGYDAISAVVDDVVVQITSDEKLGRFWTHRSKDGIVREKQLIVDFIVEKAGGPLYYTGREMKISHEGMRIDNEDWNILIKALKNTLKKFNVPAKETQQVLEFFDSTKKDIVEKS